MDDMDSETLYDKHQYCKKKIIIDESIKIDPAKEKELLALISNELRLSVLEKKDDIDDKKPKINISTITSTCKIKDIKFNCDNIAKYIDLSPDCIVSVSKDSGHVTSDKENIIIYRSLIDKDRKKKKTQKKKSFYNQVSMYVKINSKIEGYVHVKIFTNGSMQITGCKSAEDISIVLIVLMNKLRETKAIINNGKIEEKPFVSDINLADIKHIIDLKINMINTNFKTKFHINLPKLQQMLLSCGYKSVYDRMKHSCVNLKYNHPDKKISIFVFEQGSIVITGAISGDQILTGFEFINKFLLANYHKLCKTDVGSCVNALGTLQVIAN